VAAFALIFCMVGCPKKQPPGKDSIRHQYACVHAIKLGDLDVAEARCDLCLEYRRSDAECTNAKGLIAYFRGDFSEARDWYKRALRLEDELAEARNNLGVLLLDVDGNLEDAETMFRSAIKIDAGYQDARLNLARCLQQQGDRAFIQGEQRAAGSADPAVLKAAFAAADERYTAADTQLRRLHELNPLRSDVWFRRGYIDLQRARYTPHQRTRLLERAHTSNTRCMELAVAGSPDGVRCRGNGAAALEQLGQCDAAMEHYLGCLTLQPGELECQRGVERTHGCVSAASGALQLALGDVVKHPADPVRHLAVCAAAAQAGLPELAASSCENAVQLDQSLCQARMFLAEHYQRVDAAQALRHCTAVLQCAPAGSPLWNECLQVVAAVGQSP